jgi:UDP:flavonoid glycosyltransferase YjiC (YdhE family)
MARILFAWEFGANLGHLLQLVPLALNLRSRGHRPVFVVSDVTRVEGLLGNHSLEYMQAPVWHPRLPRPSVVPCSYSEILHHYGYLEPDGLLGMAKAWRQIFRLVEPSVIVFEHAPTALVASRELDAARVLHGVGFCSPPRVSPFPNFRSWEEVPRERLEQSDERVLSTINSVLGKLNLRSLGALHELFDVDEDFLCTFPELDHYASRPDANYQGPLFMREEGMVPVWPEHGHKRVYVYVRPDMRVFHPLAQHLSGAGHRVLWFAPGIDGDTVRRYQSRSLEFVREPVRLSSIAAEAEAAVLYGGHGTVSAMLLAGVPIAMYPMHVEQALVTGKVAKLGAGVTAQPHVPAAEVAAALAPVLQDDRYREKARAFAAKYAHFDPAQVVTRIAQRISAHCEERV